MKLDCSWEKDGFRMRPARMEEAERYYEQNFNPLDPETARMTGCKAAFPEKRCFPSSAARSNLPTAAFSWYLLPTGA